MKQRQNHEKLAMNKNVALYPDTKYYILPSSWLSKWRSYINASGKNAFSAELDTLTTVVDMLLCKKVVQDLLQCFYATIFTSFYILILYALLKTQI